MRLAADRTLIDGLRESAHPFDRTVSSDDALIGMLGQAQLVLLGEASHGTHEFYRERARLSKRLIEEHGFGAVAVEADWPDAYRVNRWVRGEGERQEATDALSGFTRFPTWMWRNADVLDFVGWLRAFNEEHRRGVGFYGLDLYSLFTSIDEVIRFLESRSPPLARAARERYGCFSHFPDPEQYGRASHEGLAGCEQQVVAQLTELREYASHLDGTTDFFAAEQNARLAKNAEAYYRTMFRGRVSSWNLRDRHMAETLDAILGRLGSGAKVIVWEHNSHLGDARATQFARSGELNVGQLVREKYGDRVRSVGFTTHDGTVTAANDWDEPAERMRVRPSLEGSYERLFHDTGLERFWLDLRELGEAARGLSEARLERAIGVVYRPETERWSHYFEATLPAQFDAVVHLDHTRALEPLERTATWHHGEEPPETFPSGI